MNLIIRKAVREDAQSIASIGHGSFTWAFKELFRAEVLARYLAGTYSAEKISGSLAKPTNVYFVAEVDGLVQGFLKLKGSGFDAEAERIAGQGAESWQVQKLYVNPDVVQSGIGRQLMKAGEDLMRSQGAARSWLVVYKGNDRAIRFYNSLGYEEEGVEFHDFEDIRIEFKRMSKPYAESMNTCF